MAKTPESVRKLRISQGRCPHHGIRVYQSDGWYYADTKEACTKEICPYPEDTGGRELFTFFDCPHKDCETVLYAPTPDGPFEVACDYTEELLREKMEKKVIPFPKSRIKRKRKRITR